jgi:hypothetical protein
MSTRTAERQARIDMRHEANLMVSSARNCDCADCTAWIPGVGRRNWFPNTPVSVLVAQGEAYLAERHAERCDSSCTEHGVTSTSTWMGFAR